VGQDQSTDAQGYAWFWLAKKVGDSFINENVRKAPGYVDTYWGAASSQRKWIAYNDGFGIMKLFSSSQPGVWANVPTGQGANMGLTMIALDDTSVLATWSNTPGGMRWGTLQGSTWTVGPDILGSALSLAPVLRTRPNGGYWLGNGTDDYYVLVRPFVNGVWGSPTVITANYPDDPIYHDSDSFEMSRDAGEYPAVAWSAFDGLRGVEGVYVSVPTDTGWTVADELADDVEGGAPTVARDRNGDVWAAFWRFTMSGMFITHTYTRATTTRLCLKTG
jgi:hypothetical protein